MDNITKIDTSTPNTSNTISNTPTTPTLNTNFEDELPEVDEFENHIMSYISLLHPDDKLFLINVLPSL